MMARGYDNLIDSIIRGMAIPTNMAIPRTACDVTMTDNALYSFHQGRNRRLCEVVCKRIIEKLNNLFDRTVTTIVTTAVLHIAFTG